MPRSLEIKLVDQVAAEGGGTKLTVNEDGKQTHCDTYDHDQLEKAKEVAAGFLKRSEFDNVPSGRRLDV